MKPARHSSPSISFPLRGIAILAIFLHAVACAGANFEMQADSHFMNTQQVSFAYGSNPGTTRFFAACGTVTPTNDSTPVYRAPYYWVDTIYTPCETENTTNLVTADPAYGVNQTKTVLLTERYHIGCNFSRDLGVFTFQAGTTNPAAALVTVTVIPAQAGSVSPASGWSAWDALYGQYVFFSTYTASPSYAGRVRVKFTTSGNSLIISFDQNSELTNLSTTWRTIGDRFSADQYNDYQVYRLDLQAGRKYDFPLCAADGVGASCAGDGDLELFNASGTRLWYIDGRSACSYDASTLGTAYEGWSPSSTGYYFLKVTDYSGGSMAYTLAYREQLAVQPPVITSQPVSRTNDAGTTATFTVTASGSPTLWYQWRNTNGSVWPCATTSSLVLINVLNANEGAYY